MLDTLAAVLAHIGDDAVTAITAQFLAQLCNGCKDMSQQRGILLRQHSGRVNVFFGNDQKMHRGLRVNVIECQQLVIFVQFAVCGIVKSELDKNA